VTPKGLAEKSRMVSGYLYRAMTFFRDTRIELEALFKDCSRRNIRKIAMVGTGDVANIAKLVSNGFELDLTFVEQNKEQTETFKNFDAVLITDMANPPGTFDNLKECIEEEKLLTITTLCIARRRIKTARQLEREKEMNA